MTDLLKIYAVGPVLPYGRSFRIWEWQLSGSYDFTALGSLSFAFTSDVVVSVSLHSCPLAILLLAYFQYYFLF